MDHLSLPDWGIAFYARSAHIHISHQSDRFFLKQNLAAFARWGFDVFLPSPETWKSEPVNVAFFTIFALASDVFLEGQRTENRDMMRVAQSTHCILRRLRPVLIADGLTGMGETDK